MGALSDVSASVASGNKGRRTSGRALSRLLMWLRSSNTLFRVLGCGVASLPTSAGSSLVSNCGWGVHARGGSTRSRRGQQGCCMSTHNITQIHSTHVGPCQAYMQCACLTWAGGAADRRQAVSLKITGITTHRLKLLICG